MEQHIAIILVSLFFSAFFSGIEIAYISSNKLQIELQKNQGSTSGKLLALVTKRPANFIGTTLIGNNIALVVYGIFMALVLEPIIAVYVSSSFLVLFLQTIISTLIVLATAEFIPKSLFLINPNWLLSFFAVPITIIYGLLYIPMVIIVGLSKLVITKLFRLEYSDDKPVFGLTDLNNFIQNTFEVQTESKIEVDTKIFNNALEFKAVRIRECMAPRTEVVAVSENDTIGELTDAFIRSGHSKILVYTDSIDEIIGFCHSLDLFKKPDKISDILAPIIIVPETLLANELLIQFINEHKSLALVVDEFGGTSGIVSIEDIIEEIFGEIQDEHDQEDLIVQKLDEKNYLVSARHEIDFLNEEYNWDIPEGDYDTLGGYILSITEDIPASNEILDVKNMVITIKSMQEARIGLVQLTLKRPPISNT